ncbi:uncharacterized protein LOC117107713 [Anneissia japonica]|uniref:uncharacterized protein LOC117107713 n=1 Tax=Anneissia japonica TaxID=1529436 RepID=UPI00142566B3|nr:uncharacterized protein LOC117107713 [Anneissia japonica]
MQAIISKCLVFSSLLTYIYSNASTKDIFYSGNRIINGTEGKYTTITYILKTFIPGNEKNFVQWLKDGNIVDDRDDRFTFNEEKGMFSLRIDPLQRLDKGRYSIMYGNYTPPETVLNIIEIPSKDYFMVGLNVNKNQLEIFCMSEKTWPLPSLSINGKELDLKENLTNIWTIKRVPIKVDMTKEIYTCVLKIMNHHPYLMTLNGSVITKYLTNIGYGSTQPTHTNGLDTDTSTSIDLKLLLLLLLVLLLQQL